MEEPIVYIKFAFDFKKLFSGSKLGIGMYETMNSQYQSAIESWGKKNIPRLLTDMIELIDSTISYLRFDDVDKSISKLCEILTLNLFKKYTKRYYKLDLSDPEQLQIIIECSKKRFDELNLKGLNKETTPDDLFAELAAEIESTDSDTYHGSEEGQFNLGKYIDSELFKELYGSENEYDEDEYDDGLCYSVKLLSIKKCEPIIENYKLF